MSKTIQQLKASNERRLKNVGQRVTEIVTLDEQKMVCPCFDLSSSVLFFKILLKKQVLE